ncbi:hypothetical protein O6H91_Y373000 [Diphasiastrum complanatum]|nr:hypothetical protein O6H91_Y373000 [Diphasiastrum complanatum]
MVVFCKASDDARKMVEEARAVANSEIETARAAARRVEAAFQEESKRWSTSEKKELEDMRLEVQEARRIKMLHESSKAMDMEHIIDGLKHQVAEKSSEILKLRKELEALRQHEEESKLYQLQGAECLGSCLQIVALNEVAPQISMCSIKWYRVSSDGIKAELISGATRSQYAPEPFDVGRIVRVDISLPDGRNQTLCSSGPIDPAPGLGPFVEALTQKGGADFHVIIVQQNGELMEKQSLHVLNIGKMRIKLYKGRTTKVKEHYTPAMQLCGARGGGEAAALCLFWIAKKGQSFMLGFESERERNAAIMLARRFAFDCNVMLAGPDDRAPLGT